MLKVISTHKNKILNTRDWKLYNNNGHKYFFNQSKSRKTHAFHYFYSKGYKESIIMLDFLVHRYEENKI